MAEQYLDIIDLIQTKSQADTYLSEIELLRNSLYNVKDTVDEKKVRDLFHLIAVPAVEG